MSIDAIINRVIEEDGRITLDLMSREIDGLRGQPQLIIHNPTHRPAVGQYIWGSDIVVIEPNKDVPTTRKYKRYGYVNLEESAPQEE